MKFNTFFRKKSVEKILSDTEHENMHSGGLIKSLTVTDLTSFGIAAIIGAGVFTTIGRAAADGGPAISLLFIGFAIACIFSAYCYAQFASTVPISGSAYTYAYTSLGEIVAWILGWNLILEYAISNVTVAISWSEYFTTLLAGFKIHIPDFLTTGFFSAKSAESDFQELLKQGGKIPENLKYAHEIWQTAPKIGSLPFIIDLPALLITVFITGLVFVGIKESKNANNVLVVLKLLVIGLVIGAGFFYVEPQNWIPFAPEGISGVMKGVAAVSFAYIGFDSISTTAEECKDPQRDIPRSMMYSLLICTVLYVATTLILTGMVNYKELGVGDPLAYVFEKVNMNFIAGIVAVGAVVAMTSALLVYQISQPRIWMVMSRDGLLPKVFSKLHPKYKTPAFSTIVTGCVVGIPSLFMDQKYVTDLTAIGTLFAFSLVCGGVLMLDQKDIKSKFKVPYVNGKFIVPLLFVTTILVLFTVFPEVIQKWTAEFTGDGLGDVLLKIGFFVFWGWLSLMTFTKNLSLMPVLGVLINSYLMTELGTENWIRFVVWCLIGFGIYFGYSYKRSKLNI